MANDYSVNGTGIRSSLSGTSTRKGISKQVSSVPPATTTAGNSSEKNSAGASYFKEGNAFYGQVTNITPKEITITTDDGKIITAKYDNSVELSIGESSSFLVTSTENGQITLKASGSGIPSDISANSAVLKALDNASLPITSRNVDLVSALLRHNMPVGKEMLTGVLQFSYRNPDVSISNLVTMLHHGFPIDPETTRQFENYSNLDNALSSYMELVTEDVLSLLDGIIDGSDSGIRDVAIFTDKLFDIFDAAELTEPLPDGKVVRGFAFEEAGRDALYDGILQFSISQADSDNEPAGLIQLIESLFGKRDDNPSSDSSGSAGKAVAKSTSQPASVSKDSAKSSAKASADSASVFSSFRDVLQGDSDADLYSEADKELPAASRNGLLPDTITSEEAMDYLKFLRSVGNYRLFSNTETPTLSDLSSATMQAEQGISMKGLKAILSHPTFEKLVKNLVSKNWTLDPFTGKVNQSSVRELYSRMYSQINDLIFATSALQTNTSKISHTLTGLKQNINFMNTLNTMYTYIQMPLSLSAGTTHSELYVYTDKQSLRNKGNNQVSCLLHLDMANLGKTDVHILLNGDNITTRIKVDDEHSAKIISEHISELDNAVNAHGFKAKSSVLKPDEAFEEFDFVKSFIEHDTPSAGVSRYSFDVRA